MLPHSCAHCFIPLSSIIHAYKSRNISQEFIKIFNTMSREVEETKLELIGGGRNRTQKAMLDIKVMHTLSNTSYNTHSNYNTD